MEKHTKQLVGLGVIAVGGYLLYNYWKSQNPAPTTPTTKTGTTATPTASMVGMVGLNGFKKGLTGYAPLEGFGKSFAGENINVKDAQFAKAEGGGTLPKVAGKFYDVKSTNW